MAKNFKRAIAVLLSALMIATSLPFTAITAMAADSVTYDFSASWGESYGWFYETFNENGHGYDVMASNNSEHFNISNSQIDMTNAVVFCNDDTVRTYVRSDAWTVEFTAKAKDAGDYVLYGLGGADGDFVRLDTNGSFMANGIWTNVAINSLELTDYAITYNGSSVKLYVNGIEVASIITTLNVKFANNGTLYSALGWTDTCGKAKINGVYTSYSISNTAFDADAYIMSKITADLANNAKAESFNAKAYHTRNEAVGGYSNVVYQKSDSTAWNSDYVNINGFSVKFAVPSNIVLAYDGVNEVRQPVVLESKSSNGNGGPVMRTVFPTDRSTLAFADGGYWRGDHNTDHTLYRYNDTDSKIGYAPYKDMDTESQDNKNTPRFWYNTLSYVGNGNTDTYYDHIGTLQWNVYAGSSSKNCSDNFVNSNGNTYILNYKPAYDILNDVAFKTLYNKVYANQSEYTEDSLKAYLIAVYKMAKLNVNTSFGSVTNDTIGGVVASVAKEIKSVTTEYKTAVQNLECAHVNTTDADSNVVASNCVDTGSKTVTTTCDYCRETLNVQDNVVIPVDAENHKGPEVKGDVVAPTASKNGYTGNTYCDACKTMLREDGDVDPATGNYEAYTNILAVVEELEESQYTAGSWADLQTALTNAKDNIYNVDTQQEIDSYVSAIQTAINELVLKGFTVTVNVQKNGEPVGTITETVDSGNVYTYSAQDGDVIYKATVGGERIVNNVDSFEVVVTKDITIDVYLANYVAEDTKVKAVFKNISGTIVSIQYYDKAEDITEVKMPNGPVVPFYAFAGWHLASSTDNVREYVPVYNAEALDMCNVIAASNEITVKGMPEYSAAYDEIVGVSTPANTVAIGMYADEDCRELLAVIDSTTYIHAPHRDYVYVKPLDWAGPSIGITGKYSYIDNAGMQTVVFNGNKYGDATEVGIIATVNPVLAGEYADFFVVGQKGVVKAESTKQTKIGEFTVAIHSDFGDYEKVYARPYMVVDGQTIYGNIVELGIAQKS